MPINYLYLLEVTIYVILREQLKLNYVLTLISTFHLYTKLMKVKKEKHNIYDLVFGKGYSSINKL